ncbi:MAG: hypothetical protein HGB34_01040 [Candidatus Moranbacteria bacterium]|nr:hypothetical protein [Candidatus Moranbacteria bacterium]
MSELKQLFANRDGQEDHVVLSPEEYRHIHVMQNDIDELSGKPSVPSVGVDVDVSASVAGNPFLGGEESLTPQTASDVPVTPEKNASVAARRLTASINEKPWVRYGGVAAVVLVIVVATALFMRLSWVRSDVVDVRVEESPNVAEGPSIADSMPIETPTEGKYSLTGANYLQFNTDSTETTADMIASVLNETEAEVLSMTAVSPVEFLVRDQNNNPIAFSRFAYLMDLKLPEEIVTGIDESFSIYFVVDGTSVRRALSLHVRDLSSFGESVKKNEVSLPLLLKPLLYGNTRVVPSVAMFRDGLFATVPTRYSVLDVAGSHSFDYALYNNRWIIGTSKDSFRTILGVIAQESSKR